MGKAGRRRRAAPAFRARKDAYKEGLRLAVIAASDRDAERALNLADELARGHMTKRQIEAAQDEVNREFREAEMRAPAPQLAITAWQLALAARSDEDARAGCEMVFGVLVGGLPEPFQARLKEAAAARARAGPTERRDVTRLIAEARELTGEGAEGRGVL